MSFSTLLFVYGFLPVNLLLLRLARDRQAENKILFFTSLIFYLWHGPRALLLLMFMVFLAWGSGLWMDRTRSFAHRTVALVLPLLLELSCLIFFQTRPGPLPAGISFYTFQLITYQVDVYRKTLWSENNYATLLFYVAFYPRCLSGPIVRYAPFKCELDRRQRNSVDLTYGSLRFSVGLFKKAFLANALGEMAQPFLLTQDPAGLAKVPAAGLWLGMFYFMLQIYFDFSGYSDMAVGLGLMLGFHLPENFHYPYCASSITEFWRRWHITLGTFFRDYVYIPLGGNRQGRERTLLNLLVVWLLTGLWHGISWNFVLWGLYFFCFVALEHLGWRRYLETCPAWLGHLYCLSVVYIGWIFFKFDQPGSLGLALKGLVGLNGNPRTTLAVSLSLRNNFYLLILAILMAGGFFHRVREGVEEWSHGQRKAPALLPVLDTVVTLLCLILASLAMVGSSFQPFLYEKF